MIDAQVDSAHKNTAASHVQLSPNSSDAENIAEAVAAKIVVATDMGKLFTAALKTVAKFMSVRTLMFRPGDS